MAQKNSEARKRELAERRQRQRTRQYGFTPVRNDRLMKQIEGRQVLMQLAQPGLSAAEARRQAFDAVAKGLPAIGFQKVAIRRHKYSRNDSPVYRGIGGCGPRRQAELAR